jgi:hypothetical protein
VSFGFNADQRNRRPEPSRFTSVPKPIPSLGARGCPVDDHDYASKGHKRTHSKPT